MPRAGRPPYEPLYVPHSLACSEIARAEEVISCLFGELHKLTVTWGRGGGADEGDDVILAADAERFIRAAQAAVVAAQTACYAAGRKKSQLP